MKAKVYFTSFRSSAANNFRDRLQQLLKKADFEAGFRKNDFVGIKMHFGELGNTGFIHPVYMRMIVDYYRTQPVRLFLTDTNTIYVGSRSNAVDHIRTALVNGFAYATMGIPIIIADGLKGMDYQEIQIDQEIFTKVKIAKVISETDKLIVASHVKGHFVSGFGGALKNIGMGCGSRAQKYAMHSTLNPFVIEKKCTGCGRCIKWCPVDAISLMDDKARINDNRCVGCGECIEVCPEGAMTLNWSNDTIRVQKAWVETGYGVLQKVKKENMVYINFINNVTPDCDCWEYSDSAIVPDIGVLVSRDIVAIDKASVDLINQTQGLDNTRLKRNKGKGEDKFKGLFPEVDWKIQIDYAEHLGMGTQEYELAEIK